MANDSSKPLRKIKPIRMLQALNSSEIDRFAAYLDALPFSKGKDQQMRDFFAHCHRLKVWESDIDRATFLRQSDLQMDNNTFYKVTSRLYNCLMEFAGLSGLLQQSGDLYPYALRYLGSQAMGPKEIDKKVSEGLRVLEKNLQNANYFRMSLDLRLVLANASQARGEKPDSRGLNHLHTDLDAYYFMQKLRFLCASINEQNVYGNQWDLEDEAHIQSLFDSWYTRMPDLGRAYYHAYLILRGKEESKHFEKFRVLLTHLVTDHAHNTEVTDLYGYLLNHFLIRLNNGELATLPLIDNLFGVLLENNVLLENGKLSPEYFKNIIAIKCRLGKVNEASIFFEHFRTRLTRTQDGTAIRYNAAYLAAQQKRYQESRSMIEGMIDSSETNRADQYYGLALRCLLLKVYFALLAELDLAAWDEAEEKLAGLLRSFRGYIERREISRMSKVRFENFRKGILRLYQLFYALPETEDFETVRRELLNEFQHSTNLPDKGWFIAQIQPVG